MAIRGRIIPGFFLLALLSCFSFPAVAADVSLAWDASPSENISGYKIYIGKASGIYDNAITIGNQTSYKVTNLSAGTWYFAATAYDVDGIESDFSNEVAKTIEQSNQDSTPPVISDVTSSGISGSSATISWLTNEGSDTQIEYGITAGYGSSTPVNSSLVTAHSQNITGLLPGTPYHYRVRSSDASGNVAVSGDYVFTTQGTGSAPVISNIEVSNITCRGALISWTTDHPADSQVEYWSADEAVRRSAVDLFAVNHSIALNRLRKQTLYIFKITSADSAGYQSTSAEYTFTTPENCTLADVLPRFTDGQDKVSPGEEIAIGIALANLSAEDADITLTARASNGKLISGQDIVDPGALQLSGFNQQAKLDTEIFGSGLERSGPKGWIKLESANADVAGFFLAFDSKLSFMDGTRLGDAPLTNLVFPEVETSGYTKMDIINDSEEQAEATIDLVTAEGAVRSSLTRAIDGNGSLVDDLFRDLFANIKPAASDYVRIRSTKGVQAFLLMRKGDGDISSLAGQDMGEGGTTLYSPQYVQGGDWKTTLSIVNLESRAGTVELKFLGEDGVQIGETKTAQIPANGKLNIDDAEFFGPLDPTRIVCGYVKIVSDGIRMAGSTAFRNPNKISFSTVLPLIDNLHNSVVFSHVASNDIYYTGLAIVNPNEAGTYANIEVYAANGSPIAKRSVYIPAGQRKTKLLTEFFPSLEGQDQCSGYIRVISDLPLASFAMFGTTNMSVLSAIPPQVIQ